MGLLIDVLGTLTLTLLVIYLVAAPTAAAIDQLRPHEDVDATTDDVPARGTSRRWTLPEMAPMIVIGGHLYRGVISASGSVFHLARITTTDEADDEALLQRRFSGLDNAPRIDPLGRFHSVLHRYSRPFRMLTTRDMQRRNIRLCPRCRKTAEAA